MSYEDKSITCVDCGAEFTFSADDAAAFRGTWLFQRTQALQVLPRCQEGSRRRARWWWRRRPWRLRRRRWWRTRLVLVARWWRRRARSSTGPLSGCSRRTCAQLWQAGTEVPVQAIWIAPGLLPRVLPGSARLSQPLRSKPLKYDQGLRRNSRAFFAAHKPPNAPIAKVTKGTQRGEKNRRDVVGRSICDGYVGAFVGGGDQGLGIDLYAKFNLRAAFATHLIHKCGDLLSAKPMRYGAKIGINGALKNHCALLNNQAMPYILFFWSSMCSNIQTRR